MPKQDNQSDNICWKNANSKSSCQAPAYDCALARGDVMGAVLSVAVRKSIQNRFLIIEEKKLYEGCLVSLRTGHYWIIQRINENGMLKLVGGSIPCNPRDCNLA